MKLVSCYIENFGGLSRYTCNFNTGITEFQEPNGFGKTTLAEFIRAMFYGFPRANKSIKKDKRKKYCPWQGGKYGGNLVFEYEGNLYRIERFFGAGPASDTFDLYDMATHRKSTRFSSNIGVELFQLDSDSFERSTYFPQLYDVTSLSTDSIQAKLGDLVNDTNDVNNYEKAVKAIQSKRSSLIPFRGQGGIVGSAQQRISEIEETLSGSRSKRLELEELQQELSKKREEYKIKEGDRDSVLEKIGQASEAARKNIIMEQLSGMKEKYDQECQMRDKLQEKYPCGLPTMEEIESLLQVYVDVAPLKAPSTMTVTYESAKQQLQENAGRFAGGMPTDADFSEYQERFQDYTNKNNLLKKLELSYDEKEKLEELERFFSPGVPNEEFLTDCKEYQQKIRDWQAEASSQNLPLDEQARLEELQQFFAARVPSDDELVTKQQELQKIEQLKQENNSIASSVVAPIVADTSLQKKNTAFFPALLFGIVAIIIGVVFLAQQLFAIGGGLLGIGVILSVFAIYLHLKGMISREVSASNQRVPQMCEADRQRIRDNEMDIRNLEQSLSSFLSEYDYNSGNLSEKLSELQSKQREFLSLARMKQTFDEKQGALQKQIQLSVSWLEEHLSPYFGSEIPADAHTILNWKSNEYTNLQDKRQRSATESANLFGEIASIESEIRAFLEPYLEQVETKDFSSHLATLRYDCNAYIQNQRIVSEYEAENANREREIKEYGKRISEFAQQYGLELDIDSRQVVQTLRDDAKDYFEKVGLIANLKADIEEFTAKNEAIIAAPIVEEQYDLDSLQVTKKNLDGEISNISNLLIETNQAIKNIQPEVDQIPQREDELADWKAVFKTGRQQADLLDQTIGFLQQAKEQLSTSYLGTIRSSFSDLLHRLTGEMSENILVDTQLDVQLERHGETRSLAYFSVGQLDIIMLCMRIALVKALFKDVKPFIILDDPFINLDNEHTAEALALIKDIAEEYQIIYFVCNSSRTLGNSEK